ncbi:MAG: glycoside hydrolase family 2 protein, partial [Lachnospiraceae bacterium]|nr:glycoside hydrolase family 2 protein [Lachnospiraceae bacterium]
KVDKFNDAYRMVETGDVLNWFEITAPEGYFSINDKAGEVLATTEGKQLFSELMKSAGKDKKAMTDPEQMMSSKDMLGFLSGFTVKRLLSMFGAMGAKPLTKDEMLMLNGKLNKIKKK